MATRGMSQCSWTCAAMAEEGALKGSELTLDANEAHRLAIAALRSRGVRADVARDVADSLVGAEIAGKPTHGLHLLPRYLADLDAGKLDRSAVVSVDEHGFHAVVHGSRVPGAHVASTALSLASRVARRTGFATVAMPDIAHCGRLGGYVEAIAAGDQIAMMTVGSLNSDDGFVSPFGGRGRRLDTNPIAFAFPAVRGPVVIDLATSAVTYNHVRLCAANNVPLDAGTACDASGRPTTVASEVLDGGWALPLAGAQGFALALIAPLLAALAEGSESGTLTGAYAVVLDVATQTDPAEYRARVQSSLDRLTKFEQHSGAVRIPGQDRSTRIALGAELMYALKTEAGVVA